MKVGGCVRVLTAVNIAHSVTYYTRSINIGSHGTSFGVFIKGTSAASAPDFDLTYEQSYTLPATEQASDANWVTPDGITNIVTSRVAETAFITSISPVPMTYIRFKLTTNAGSNDDSLFTIVLFRQEG